MSSIFRGLSEAAVSYMVTYLLVCLMSAIIGIKIATQITTDMCTESERTKFKEFVAAFICFVLSNAVAVVCNTCRLGELGTVFSVITLVTIVVTLFEWFGFVQVRMGSNIFDDLKKKALLTVPVIVQIIMIISTPFTHFVFYYENGVYMRGAFYMPILLLLLPYTVYGSFTVFRNLSEARTREQKKFYFILMLFMLFPILGAVIDEFIPHLPILELMSLLGIVVVFTEMQQSNIFVDTLTGMNNRRKATERISEMLQNADSEEFILYLADIDHFKKINDHFGHTEGDKALRLVAVAFRRFGRRRKCLIARWGGDEFVLIGKKEDLDDTDNVIKEINDELIKICEQSGISYWISMSVGYTTCNSSKMTESELILRADKMMYSMKP